MLVVLALLLFAGVVGASPLAQEDEGVPYTVKPGDYLIQLAREIFGDAGAFQRIIDATNEMAAKDSSYRAITDANIVLVGQKLWIPGLSALPAGMGQDMAASDEEADMDTSADTGATTETPAAGTDEIVPTADLAGTGWVMSSLDGQPPVDGTTVTLNFTSTTEVSGHSGCNGFGGSYEADGFHIEFGPLVGTLIACLDEGVMEQEAAFRTALENAAYYEVADGNLRLFDADSTMLVELTPASTSLDGTSWNVTNYNNGREAVVGVLADTELTAVFEGDQISGSAGCNNYFGSFTADDGAISIGPLAATRRACFGEGVMEQETEFLAALESAATYSMVGSRLEMRTADDALAVVLVPQ